MDEKVLKEAINKKYEWFEETYKTLLKIEKDMATEEEIKVFQYDFATIFLPKNLKIFNDFDFACKQPILINMLLIFFGYSVFARMNIVLPATIEEAYDKMFDYLNNNLFVNKMVYSKNHTLAYRAAIYSCLMMLLNHGYQKVNYEYIMEHYEDIYGLNVSIDTSKDKNKMCLIKHKTLCEFFPELNDDVESLKLRFTLENYENLIDIVF